jgi:ubiquinone/menaquinone biosynthesis C-methylase UbiE
LKQDTYAREAATFYDGYHQASDEMSADHPVRMKTRALHLKWLKGLAPAHGARMLDLSCGLGYLLSAAREFDPSLRLTGLDHSAYAVKRAQALVPGARVVRGDALRTGLPA